MRQCIYSKPGRCDILTEKNCEGCRSSVMDPKIHLRRLVELFRYQDGKGASTASIRAEIKGFCHKYKLKVPDLTEKEEEHNPYAGLRQAYLEDISRGEKGGASEGNDNNNVKQLMHDNRSRDTKLNSVEREKLRKATQEWEEQNGKLPKLSRSSMGRSTHCDGYLGMDD